MWIKVVTTRLAAVSCLLLAACGGGGGGSGSSGNVPPPPPQLTLSQTSITVTNDTSNTSPTSATIDATVTGITGTTYVGGTFTAVGLWEVTSSQTDATHYQLELQFRDAPTLAPGTYDDFIRLQLCSDRDRSMAQECLAAGALVVGVRADTTLLVKAAKALAESFRKERVLEASGTPSGSIY